MICDLQPSHFSEILHRSKLSSKIVSFYVNHVSKACPIFIFLGTWLLLFSMKRLEFSIGIAHHASPIEHVSIFLTHNGALVQPHNRNDDVVVNLFKHTEKKFFIQHLRLQTHLH